MAESIRAFDELAAFFASKIPDDLIAFQPSKATSDRVELLIFKEKRDGLTVEEKGELDAYMVLEHIMRLAKKVRRGKMGIETGLYQMRFIQRSIRRGWCICEPDCNKRKKRSYTIKIEALQFDCFVDYWGLVGI